MGKNVNHLQHIKSNVVINGQPKLPGSEVLVEGELAVNYASGYETISLINSDNETVRFSSDDYYTKLKLGDLFSGENSANTITNIIEENERIVSSSLNDLEDRKAEKTELSEINNSIEEMELTLVSAINDIESRIADKVTIAALAEQIRALTERVKALEDKTA